MPVLFNCPRGGAEGVLVAAPGDDGGTRTRNLRFGMSTLCQLSYHHHVFVGTLSAGGLGEAVSSPLYEPPPRGIDSLALPWSGKRDLNPQPSAWKADALPN